MDGAKQTGCVSIYFYSLQTFCAGCRPVLLATRQWRPKWLSQRPWKIKSPATIAGGAMAAVANRGVERGTAVLLLGKPELVAFTPLLQSPGILLLSRVQSAKSCENNKLAHLQYHDFDLELIISCLFSQRQVLLFETKIPLSSWGF